MQHTAFWCSLREEQATSLKNTEGNPAHDPSQKEMERSLLIKTTVSQATGCNFRVSKKTVLCCDIFRKKDGFFSAGEVWGLLHPISTHKILPCFVFFLWPLLHLIQFWLDPVIGIWWSSRRALKITPSGFNLVIGVMGKKNKKHASGCIRPLKNVKSDMRNCSRLI